jgi:hypothetical protein
VWQARAVLLAALPLALAGCDWIPMPVLFPNAIVLSQESYDFGMSDLPWGFQVWTDNPNFQTLRFTVKSSANWIVCAPTNGVSTGPEDKQTITVTIDRTKLAAGSYEGTITISTFLLKPKEIAITVESDGALAAGSLRITNVAHNYTSPFLLDFTFSLRDLAGNPIIAEPAQFSIAAMENGERISRSETGVQLSKAANKQFKAFLVLDYTASMADPINGDSDHDGKSDAIEAMENAAKYILLPSLTDDALVGVYEFHRDSDPQLVCDLTVDKEHVRDCIDRIWDDYVLNYPGSSRAWDAVYMAVDRFGTENQMDESRNIIFLSDGRDESSTRTTQNIVTLARNRGVRLYCVGFGAELDITGLQLLTAQTQGDFFPAETTEQLPEMFRQILRDLGGQYTLRWTTLKRGEDSFKASFLMSAGELQALYNESAAYTPDSHTGNTERGILRFVPSQTNRGTTLFLRSAYVPRYIRTIRLYLRSPHPFTVSKVGLIDGGLAAYWLMLAEDDLEHGGMWVTLESADPDDLFSGLGYGAFGPLLRFDFDEFLPEDEPAFDSVYIDNAVYDGGQYLTVEGYTSPAPE